MFFNLAKLLQKCILAALAIVLCLIVMENFLNRFILYQLNGPKDSVARESSIVVLEQQQAVEAAVDSNSNNDVAATLSSTDDSQMSEAAAILLWWTPFIGEMEYTKNCGNSVCFFTGNQKYFNHEKLKVVARNCDFARSLQLNCFTCRHCCSTAAI